MTALAVLVLIGVLAIGALAYAAMQRRHSRGMGGSPSRWIYAAGLIPGILFFLMLQAGPGSAEPALILFAMAFAVCLAVIWVRAIVNLMWLSDDVFPGHN